MFEYTLFYMPNGSILLGIILIHNPSQVLLPAIWSKEGAMYPLPGALECIVTPSSYSFKAEMADDPIKQEYCCHLLQDIEEYPDITAMLIDNMGKELFEKFSQNLGEYVLGCPPIDDIDGDEALEVLEDPSTPVSVDLQKYTPQMVAEELVRLIQDSKDIIKEKTNLPGLYLSTMVH